MPLNLNFFAHNTPVPNNAREHVWRERLKPITPSRDRSECARAIEQSRPFDETMWRRSAIKPEVVSHYGVPAAALVARVKAAGAK